MCGCEEGKSLMELSPAKYLSRFHAVYGDRIGLVRSDLQWYSKDERFFIVRSGFQRGEDASGLIELALFAQPDVCFGALAIEDEFADHNGLQARNDGPS